MALLLLRAAFWIPLAVCTWLALAPEPPRQLVPEISDVYLHAGAFVYLTFALLAWAGPTAEPDQRRRYLLLTGSMLGYGVFLEVAQSFTGRSPELKDIGVDVIGIAVGLLVWLAIGPAFRRSLERLADRLPAGKRRPDD